MERGRENICFPAKEGLGKPTVSQESNVGEPDLVTGISYLLADFCFRTDNITFVHFELALAFDSPLA